MPDLESQTQPRRQQPPPPSHRASDAQQWLELQAELAALSKNAERRLVPNASHYIHQEQPLAVVSAVRDVVNAVRDGSALRH